MQTITTIGLDIAKSVFHWDTDLTGFGVGVGAREKTLGNPKSVRVTLGRFGQILPVMKCHHRLKDS
ncbi:MAG: hypothetical protein ACXVKL_12425 [Candidatus Angelobacter sp.]